MNNFMYVISPDISSRSIGNEVFILNRNTNEVCNLNNSAAFIWKALAKDIPVETIAADMEKKFEVTAEQALSDILELIDELIDKKIIGKPHSST